MRRPIGQAKEIEKCIVLQSGGRGMGLTVGSMTEVWLAGCASGHVQVLSKILREA